jgi:hypothetical protein
LQPPANTGISKNISIQSLLIPLVSFLGRSLPSSIPIPGIPGKLCAMMVRMQLKSSRRAAIFADPACRPRKTFCLAKL